MAKSRNDIHELDDIKHDLDSLKSNVIALTRHLEENGVEKAHQIRNKARNQIKQVRRRGISRLHDAEDQVRAHPGQSIALAFAAGLVTALFMGRD